MQPCRSRGDQSHLTAQHGTGNQWTLKAAAPDLTWRDTADGKQVQAQTVVLAVCLSGTGKLLSRKFASLNSATEANGAQRLTMQAPLNLALEIPPRTTRIRFVVRDMISGRIGTADAKP